jgi:hypothetical protein
VRDVEDTKGHISSVVKSLCLFRRCGDVVVVVNGAILKKSVAFCLGRQAPKAISRKGSYSIY